MHRGRPVAGFERFGAAIEAGAAKLQIEQPFVGVAPPSRFGYGYAQPVIPADWLRHPLNSNVRPLMTNPEWTSKGKTVGQLFEEPIGWVGFINPA